MSQDIAHPENPAPLTEANIYEAVRQFVNAYALPAIPVEHIIQGWQNRMSLPAGTNDFAVMSIIFDVQQGTTVETFNADNPDKSVLGILTLTGLIELAVQVDICSETDIARQRAQRLAIATRSSIGAQFFNDRGMSALYAEDVRDLSYVGGEKQYVRRCMTVLRLSINEGLSVEIPYFDTVKTFRVENVDVHHKP